MRRVLIISYHFPPINNINARRFGEMAPYMPNFGWEPIILTTNSEGPLPVKIPEDNIIRLGENYYDDKKIIPPEEGYKGIPAILKIPYFFYRKFGAEISSIDRFLFKWGRTVKRNKAIIKKKKPDLIIASCYPPVSIWMGRFFSKSTKKPWIADLQDPLSLWNNSKLPFVKFLDKQIDKFLIKSALAVITISSHLSSKMEKLYHKPVEIIYNGFDPPPLFTQKWWGAERESENAAKKRKIQNLYYAGRFHNHRMPAVKLFIDWLAKNREFNFMFTIRSLGPTEANEEILKYAKEKNAFHKINLLPPASPAAIFREEKESDVLILFEDLNKQMSNSEGTLPGKLMEYLPFKAPIIAINRSDSEIGKILRETSRGCLVSDIKQLDEAMENILNGSSPDFNWEKIKKYSRKAQCQKFCAILDKVYQSQNHVQ